MTPRTRRRTGLACGALALCACAATSGEKGRLAPVDLAPQRLDAAHAPRRLALLVGVSRFDDPGWSGLRYPAKDAEDLAAVLRDPAGGAFDQVEVLDPGPTRAELLSALARLGQANRDEADTVVVYVSSHGTLARDERGLLRRYLVTRETSLRDVPGTALPIEQLKGAFEALSSRRKVLILAACHSGGGKSLLPGGVQAELRGVKGGFFERPLEEASRASLVLAASDWGETAREDEKLQNDIYTHFLVEAMRLPADRNGDGAVTASEAHDYARRATWEFTGGRQRPTAESIEVGADPIVLVGRVQRRGRPELYGYAPRLDGFSLRVDGRVATDLPGGAAVEPGRRRLQLVKGNGPPLLDGEVNLGPGERLDLDLLVDRAAGRWEVAPRLAAFSFLDGGSRRGVMGPATGLGVVVVGRDLLAPRLSLRLDVVGSAGKASIPVAGGTAGFDYAAVAGGLSAPWRLAGGDAWSLAAGPRLSALWLRRDFHRDLAGVQNLFTFTPGLMTGVSWDLGHVTLGAELQVDWAAMRVDGATRWSGLGTLLVGAGWRL